MNEYICLYIKCGLKPCIKIKANSIDNAKDKFIKYLNSIENIDCVDTNKLILIPYNYLKEIN